MLVEQAQHSEIEKLMMGTYHNFEIGDFHRAGHLLNQAHAMDFDDMEIQTAMKACGFWDQRVQRIDSITSNGSRGNYLRSQWAVFEGRYRENDEHPLEAGRSSLRTWVHREALNYYRAQVDESNDVGSILNAAGCLKILGRFDEAIENLERVLRGPGDKNVPCMAELADAYVLIGELKPGKALMREALFLDASQVNLGQLISPLFRRLIARLEEIHPVDSAAFNEWLPVYGVLWGGLDVKRELSNVEYGKLKQMIYALKSEIADGDGSGCLAPKLINCYFRLADHYQLTGADRSLIEETLMEIKLFSPAFYRKHLK